jgi:hypothetical protein
MIAADSRIQVMYTHMTSNNILGNDGNTTDICIGLDRD